MIIQFDNDRHRLYINKSQLLHVYKKIKIIYFTKARPIRLILLLRSYLLSEQGLYERPFFGKSTGKVGILLQFFYVKIFKFNYRSVALLLNNLNK